MLIPNYIHILCFGDSLTQGFTKGGNIHHPYSLALQSSLEQSFPSTRFRMDNQGRDGDQATSPPGAFVPRMDILYQETHPNDPFDYAVIMGGTNDLNGGRQPDDIYAELQRTWAIPLSHGTPVLALTVPDCGLCGQDFVNRMNKLNSLILNHEAENFYPYDFHKDIPWDLPTERWRELWDDPIHFTSKGYDFMGTKIADQIEPLIRGTETIESEDQVFIGNGELKKRDIDSRKLRSGRMVDEVGA